MFNYYLIIVLTTHPTMKSIKRLIGVWDVAYTNNFKVAIEIKSDGSVITSSTSTKQGERTSRLQESTDQANFPTSEGWLVMVKAVSAVSWDYVRSLQNGELELQNFHYGGGNVYKGTVNEYCCAGTGVNQGKK